ncbi:ABC-2 type transporter [Desulfofarcimen acetoxidans DSM 771]|jgi:Nod factor-specific ABC transporter NodJ protein|uniref:Transport permease protein n=1 Tax=Desulfofarcimen acetoxidans (strain ATCC 49208 / DSM 771 / KCTC 5769 / VKM B-1644 / 5575) TaxID=485916 RepID=C8W617_DESAS|nr:ABC transporter permease [Desulfofarcimen acetoxidans]ACV61472.1 ABC-2 type transporter [Desulfofarcimen acetoxidans DSM 771]
MSGLRAVLWREYLFFKRRWWTITTGSMVAPLLYMVAFGWGLGKTVNLGGVAYIDFIVPGIVALSTMNVSFNAVATPLSIARLYDKTLEEYLVAPITVYSFAAGKILAGALRGLYAAAILLVISWFFRADLIFNLWFVLLLCLNCLVFSSLGFLVALKIKSHPDMTRFNNFVITPMTFVCGTFFSVDRVPFPFSQIIKLLPLTPASHGLRSVALGTDLPWTEPAIQIFYLALFVIWGIKTCLKVE